MDKRIIYQNDGGGVSIIIPADCGLTIEQVAAKDVPTGKPYKIVDAADIPTDRSARDAWFVDVADLTDGVGADYGVGSQISVVGWRKNGSPIIKKIEPVEDIAVNSSSRSAGGGVIKVSSVK